MWCWEKGQGREGKKRASWTYRVFEEKRVVIHGCVAERHDIVDHDVDLEIHAPAVDLVREGFEVVRGPELAVQLGSVCDPVTMVGVAVGRALAFIVPGDGTNPDCQGEANIRLSGREGEGGTHWQ